MQTSADGGLSGWLSLTHQVDRIRDPSKEAGELHCKTTPLARAYMAGGWFQDRLWLFGGRRGRNDIWQDSWYR